MNSLLFLKKERSYKFLKNCIIIFFVLHFVPLLMFGRPNIKANIDKSICKVFEGGNLTEPLFFALLKLLSQQDFCSSFDSSF